MKFNTLISELEVSNIEASKKFYIDVLDFKLEYERKEDKFVFLSKDGSQLMLEETVDDELEYPYGRGVNLTFTVYGIERLYQKLQSEDYSVYKELTTRKFRVNDQYTTPKEFAVKDLDDYLLRFSEN